MAFTAVAAVVNGAADFATVAAAVGEVGTAMSVVGAVTGNSTLTKVGGVMGLAGGVGALASRAMSAGADAAATAVAADTTDAAANNAWISGPDQSAAETQNLQNLNSSLDGTGITGTGADAANADPANGLLTGNYVGLSPGETPASAAMADFPSTENYQPGFGSYNDTAYGAGTGTDPSLSVPGLPISPPASMSPSDASAYNGMANPSAQAATPTAATGTPAGQGAASTIPSGNSSLAGNSAFALDNQPTATIEAANANLTAPGTLIPGVNQPGVSGNSFNDATGTYAGADGSTAQVGQAANKVPGNGFFDGVTSWVESNPHMANMFGQLGSGMLSGAGRAYEANRQYQLGLGQLAINRQKQANANSQVASGGIINTARKNANNTTRS